MTGNRAPRSCPPVTRPEPGETRPLPAPRTKPTQLQERGTSAPTILVFRHQQHDAHGVGIKATPPSGGWPPASLDPPTPHTRLPKTQRETKKNNNSKPLTGTAASWMTSS